jgi:vancomycin resistance protein VanJ
MGRVKVKVLPRSATGVGCCLYFAVSLAVWLVMRYLGDRWWAATVGLLFGPRWIWLLPLGLLLPLALVKKRWGPLWALLAAGWIALVPFMGLCVPWRMVVARPSSPSNPQPQHLRILTCNMHMRALDASAMAQFIRATNPDIVVLQEWTSPYNAALFGGGNWHERRNGELCIASRYPIRSASMIDRHWKDPGAAAAYEIDTPGGPVELVNVHLDSPHHQFDHVLHFSSAGPAEVQANSDARMKQSQFLSEWAAQQEVGVIIAGDFNTVQESFIFRDAWSNFTDAFSLAGWGFGRSYSSAGWSFGSNFHARVTTARIDHVLTDSKWRCLRCWVGPDVGSPHRPLVADLEMVPPVN